MKVIPDMLRIHWGWYLRFYYATDCSIKHYVLVSGKSKIPSDGWRSVVENVQKAQSSLRPEGTCVSHTWRMDRAFVGTEEKTPNNKRLVRLQIIFFLPYALSGVRVARSLVFCVSFVDHCLSFCPFSFGHCNVCPSSLYIFILLIWYLVAIVMYVLLRFTSSHYSFGILWPL